MAAPPPVILVLDISALSAATPREWIEFSRAGSCIVPQVVYEEMKFLFDRAPDPDLERIARAFNRFYPTSGWKVSDASAHHIVLKTTSGQSMTKRSRVSLAVGRCAYGLAQTMPNSLVVVISSDRNMLQRVYDIQAPNLCAITGQSLLQWSRTGQRPIAVSQKAQQMRVASGGLLTTAAPASTYPASATRTLPKPTKTQSSAAIMPEWVPQLLHLALAVGALAIAGWLAWFVVTRSGDALRQPIGPSPDEIAPN
jgi:hypothetical protein